ncbi:hypothetical protein [Paramylibacter ulvae]|uniref:hypothetical protein n=1 Tax=Paramylibacter ulvae TaxID=1651968 RepID=UPI0016723933|nr:hypothetical protein [Amylibacter ulvae]
MNIFKSETAPFAIVIFVAALGWYISTLQEALSDRLSLIYSFSKSQSGSVFRLENISRENVFEGEFTLTCLSQDSSAPCFDVSNNNKPQYRIVTPYNLSNEIDPTMSPLGGTIKVTAWIPPSASVEIIFQSDYPLKNFRFQYFPSKNVVSKESNPKFFEKNLQSSVIKHFDSALIYAFAITSIVFAIYVAKHLLNEIKPYFKKIVPNGRRQNAQAETSNTHSPSGTGSAPPTSESSGISN